VTRPTYCAIDLVALRHNFQQVRQLAPRSKILAMVKANAYGHGIVEVAKALHEADGLGVACLEEALILRTAGIKQTIVLMEGFFKLDELVAIQQHDLEIVIHDQTQLQLFLRQQAIKPLTIWLKINTGMNRLGFQPAQVDTVWQQLKMHNAVKEIRLMTHFADADDLSRPIMRRQLDSFAETTAALAGQHSLAASAGILGWHEAHADWVRPGIMLYGISPFADRTGEYHNLKPVMTLHSEIIATHELRAGEVIGYGGTWICPHDMHIGVVAIGYGDGYPRSAVNGTPVLVNNHLTRLIGRVSMDMLTVDLHKQPQAKVGDPVVLWGNGLPVELISKHSNRSEYELLCGVSRPRIPYIYQ